jgi:arylsulfatase A
MTKLYLTHFLTGFPATVLAIVASVSFAEAKAPNFVIIYVDDLGWAETSVEMIEGRADTRSGF